MDTFDKCKRCKADKLAGFYLCSRCSEKWNVYWRANYSADFPTEVFNSWCNDTQTIVYTDKPDGWF